MGAPTWAALFERASEGPAVAVADVTAALGERREDRERPE